MSVCSSADVDVVFNFPHESFDDALDREFCRPPEQTLLALARDPRVGELLVADPWRSYVASVSRRRRVGLVEPMTVGGRAAVRVRPHRLARTDPTDVAGVVRSYRRFGELLGRALARVREVDVAAPESAALVTYHPFAAAFCDAPWISKVVYFARDDWAAHEPLRPWRDAYRQAYRCIDERGAQIFAVSAELASRLSARAEVVPNGVIGQVWRPRHPVPERIAALPRPRAIYTGTIDDRLDESLVHMTARSAGSLVLVGYPVHGPTMRWLGSLDNVYVFDPVGQRELAAMVQACDVGVIPHRDHDLTRAMSPLKLYEYLAAGLPVVSVDLPPVHGVDDERIVICSEQNWADGLM